MIEKSIPLSVPNFQGNEKIYVNDALEQGWVSTAGAYVNRLEDDIDRYLQVEKRCAVVQSGTAALHLALVNAGVMSDDMVIVPSLTFIAAVNPVRYLGAEPIFMDCDDSLCIDPIKLEEFCQNECKMNDGQLLYAKNNKCIKAIVVVHVFGNMADMEKICEIAEKYNLVVVEDATEALGTKYISGKYAGKYAGTIGDYGAYSFNGNKIITTGGGGAIVSRTIEATEHIRYLSTQAKDDSQNYFHGEIGYNYRMTNLQAALGVAQMELLEQFVETKNRNYDLYLQTIGGSEEYRLLGFRDDIRSNKWFYSLFIEDEIDIQHVIKKLAENKVQARPIWGLINEQKPYENCIAYDVCRAKEYYKHVINIPCSTCLTLEEIEYVAECIKKVI